MVRKANKGVTLVEVLFALAIFMILMIPLGNSLISGIKTTTNAKVLQYRNEYAGTLLESVKEVPIATLDSMSTAYFENLGSTGVSITKSADNTTYHKTNADGSTTPCPFVTYEMTGTTYLGPHHEEYSYCIEMSSKEHAEAEANGKSNPNNMTNGIVEALDQTKVAVISAPLSNYDSDAYDALLTRKMSEMRKVHEKEPATTQAPALLGSTEEKNAYVKDAAKFEFDKANRIINLIVEKKGTGYDVTCEISYGDDCKVPSESGAELGRVIGRVDYKPYVKHFDELPNIYLMYNVGVYNNQYTDDYFTLDLSGIDDNEKVNVFLIETASDYSDNIRNANSKAGGNLLEDTSTNPLYRTPDDLSIRDGSTLKMAVLSTGLSANKENNLHIYHNIGAPERSDYSTEAEYNAAVLEWEKHKKDAGVIYDDAAAAAVGNIMKQTYTKPLNVENLSAAQQARGLYQIKVWIRQGTVAADVLKSDSPVLQGTRGGNEID